MMLDGKPGGAAVGHILHRKQGHWILDEESVLFKVGAGPAHILLAYSEEYLLEATANYADGSWNMFFDSPYLNDSLYKQFRWGEGCRNNTSHPHETIRCRIMRFQILLFTQFGRQCLGD